MIESNIHVTPQLKSKMTLECRYNLDQKIRTVLPLFPELDAERIEVGLFSKPFSIACAKTHLKDRIKIGYNPRHPITYFTLGHELTHFVQHLDEEEKENKIPFGSITIMGEWLRRSQGVPKLTIELQVNDHGK